MWIFRTQTFMSVQSISFRRRAVWARGTMGARALTVGGLRAPESARARARGALAADGGPPAGEGCPVDDGLRERAPESGRARDGSPRRTGSWEAAAWAWACSRALTPGPSAVARAWVPP